MDARARLIAKKEAAALRAYGPGRRVSQNRSQFWLAALHLLPARLHYQLRQLPAIHWWQYTAATAAAALVLAPLVMVLASWWQPMDLYWQGLHRSEVWMAGLQTFLLLDGVLLAATGLGISLAWFTTMFAFPGRRLLSWGLLAPFLLPPYVLAHCFQQGLYWGLGYDFRSLLGLCVVLSLSFYPIVYLIARLAFASQGARSIEMARSLGQRPSGILLKVSLPLATPWIIGAVLIVAMEVMSEFAAAQSYQTTTLATLIFDAFFQFGAYNSAARLAAILVVVFLAMLLIDRMSGSRKSFSLLSGSGWLEQTLPTSPGKKAVITGFCWLVFLLAVVVPIGILVTEVLGDGGRTAVRQSIESGIFSFLTASAAAIAVVLLASSTALLERLRPYLLPQTLNVVIGLGFAIPGMVLAVVAFAPLQEILQTSTSTGGILLLTAGGLVVAYTIRFLAPGSFVIQSEVRRIPKPLDDAARVIGKSPSKLMWQIHTPLLRKSFIVAATLTFLEVLKELPLALVLRPFNFQPLTVQIFENFRLGNNSAGALPALLLLVMGLITILLASLVWIGREDRR